MSKFTAEILEIKTNLYWSISKAANGKTVQKMTTGYALQELAELRKTCKPNPKLLKRVEILLNEIIRGPSERTSKATMKQGA